MTTENMTIEDLQQELEDMRPKKVKIKPSFWHLHLDCHGVVFKDQFLLEELVRKLSVDAGLANVMPSTTVSKGRWTAAMLSHIGHVTGYYLIETGELFLDVVSGGFDQEAILDYVYDTLDPKGVNVDLIPRFARVD